MIEIYYDQLAPYYRYLFPGWEMSMLKQAQVLDRLIQECFGAGAKRILDAACGIDTLSWALLGAQVTGIDISPESLKYARLLAEKMRIDAQFISISTTATPHTMWRMTRLSSTRALSA